MRKKVICLGATGSIGSQTLDIIRTNPDQFELVAIHAHSDIAALKILSQEFPQANIFLSRGKKQEEFLNFIKVTQADIVVNGIAGASGFAPSLASLESGKDLALANKESVVMAYSLLEKMSTQNNVNIIPVDSEHASLFSLINRIARDEIKEYCITASGGPFRTRELSSFVNITAADAVKHPTWNMGRKISIDSATMANKGLEVIEAARLFHLEAKKIRVLIHPQSLVHSMVTTFDGSIFANISKPDMRIPIANALNFPNTAILPYEPLDLADKQLEFFSPEKIRYPLLELAYQALAKGYGATVAYNAADEVAVKLFEEGKIKFTMIAELVAEILEYDWPVEFFSSEEVFECDTWAHNLAQTCGEGYYVS